MMMRLAPVLRRPATRWASRLALALAVSGAPTLALAQGAPRATPVEVESTRLEAITQTAPVIGRLLARQSGVIAARTAGQVEAFKVDVGDRVEVGDLIALLDRETLELQRDLTKADLLAAEATVAVAQAQSDQAAQALKRLSRLRGSAAFNQSNYDDQVHEATRQASALREAEASVIRARSSLRLAEVALDDALIRAPYPGVVSERHTEVGSYLSVGAPVVTLVNDRDMEIEADVPHALLAGLAPGTEVAVDLRGIDAATVRAIVPNENPRTRTRLVRFTPKGEMTPQAAAGLAANQSVTLRLPTAGDEEVVTIHKDGVIASARGDMAFIVKEGVAQPRPLTLGRAVGPRFEAKGGVEPGEWVVVRGNERLRPGQAVLPMKEGQPVAEAAAPAEAPKDAPAGEAPKSGDGS